MTLADVGDLLRRHLTADDALLPYAQRLSGRGLAEQSLRGYLSGSIDVVLRVPGEEGPRYLVVDYKTNRLGDPDLPLTAADYTRERVTEAMLHSDYPLQALLYTVVVHRYLRWRQPGYDPATHLGGVLYLYVRGMCGPDTPLVDGHPAGVFSWTPPAALVTALSDLLDGVAMTEIEDPYDVRLAASADGLLQVFNEAGAIDAADVHVAQRICALGEEQEPLVALAVALAVRAVRGGSVCVDLTTVAEESLLPDLPWPTIEAWRDALSATPLTRVSAGDATVLRLLDDRLLYLDRYWREEEQVCADLLARPVPAALTPGAQALLESGLDRVFPAKGYDEQRAAARIALAQGTTVLTGGPGTGKTTTVAALLALLVEQAEAPGRPALRIALAAPTGKAAARLQQAVEDEVARLPESDRVRLTGLRAVTLHRLLGSRPDTSARFRHHRDNRLPHDVVVVDETSMVSLTMMARLLEAVRPDSRLILVGDPDQLASVEAGAVLSDLVEGLGDRVDLSVAALRTSHRYGESIRALAEAVRTGDADRAVELLHAGGDNIEFVDDLDPAPRMRELLRRPGARDAPGRRGRRGRCRAGRARPAAVAVRPPRRSSWRPTLEPAGRALARRGDRRADLDRRGTPAARSW